MEGENQLHEAVLWPPQEHHGMCAPAPPHELLPPLMTCPEMSKQTMASDASTASRGWALPRWGEHSQGEHSRGEHSQGCAALHTLLVCLSLLSSTLYFSASSRARFKRTSVALWLVAACFCNLLLFSNSCVVKKKYGVLKYHQFPFIAYTISFPCFLLSFTHGCRLSIKRHSSQGILTQN